jgi:SAM-dependent methyltransferase
MADVCRGCDAAAVRLFFDLGALPLAGGFLRGAEEIAAEQRYPLPISVCDNCGLVQIVDPVDPGVLFGDYSFATGTVAGLVRHFDAYADWIHERYHPTTVIEFGANDGTLVGALGQRGVRAVGIDMAPNVTQMARDRGLDVITGAFGPEAVPELLLMTGRVDLVTGSNVFAHNASPGAILQAVDGVLAPDGILCLEVMYAGDLLEQLQWDTLYHEHLTFYSLGTVGPLLARFGFEAIDAERIPMHGGSLRLAAARTAHTHRSPRLTDQAAD